VGCLGALIRWAIFGGVVFYILNIVGAMPQVRRVASALLRGEQVDTAPIVDAFRAFIDLPPTGSSEGPRESSPAVGPAGERADDPSDAQRVYEPGEAGVTAPVLVQRVPAVYPPEALRRRIQGTVVLRCIVEPDGTVSEATVTRSIDPTYGIDEEAVRAVKQWRFQPGRRGSEPSRVVAVVTITFARRGPASEPVSR
jgi:TonB family protein